MIAREEGDQFHLGLVIAYQWRMPGSGRNCNWNPNCNCSRGGKLSCLCFCLVNCIFQSGRGKERIRFVSALPSTYHHSFNINHKLTELNLADHTTGKFDLWIRLMIFIFCSMFILHAASFVIIYFCDITVILKNLRFFYFKLIF
jgi:hypothetical protein